MQSTQFTGLQHRYSSIDAINLLVSEHFTIWCRSYTWLYILGLRYLVRHKHPSGLNIPNGNVPLKAPIEAISYHTVVGSDTKNGLRKAFYSSYELGCGVACSIIMHRILYHIYMILLCWSWLWYQYHWVHVICVPIFFRVNTLRPGQNGHHFADDIFKCFPWMKTFSFWMKFHWIMFLRSN